MFKAIRTPIICFGGDGGGGGGEGPGKSKDKETPNYGAGKAATTAGTQSAIGAAENIGDNTNESSKINKTVKASTPVDYGKGKVAQTKATQAAVKSAPAAESKPVVKAAPKVVNTKKISEPTVTAMAAKTVAKVAEKPKAKVDYSAGKAATTAGTKMSLMSAAVSSPSGKAKANISKATTKTVDELPSSRPETAKVFTKGKTAVSSATKVSNSGVNYGAGKAATTAGTKTATMAANVSAPSGKAKANITKATQAAVNAPSAGNTITPKKAPTTIGSNLPEGGTPGADSSVNTGTAKDPVAEGSKGQGTGSKSGLTKVSKQVEDNVNINKKKKGTKVYKNPLKLSKGK